MLRRSDTGHLVSEVLCRLVAVGVLWVWVGITDRDAMIRRVARCVENPPGEELPAARRAASWCLTATVNQRTG